MPIPCCAQAGLVGQRRVAFLGRDDARFGRRRQVCPGATHGLSSSDAAFPPQRQPIQRILAVRGEQMAFPPSDFRLLRFWSDDYPAHKRLGAWAEVLSRMLLKAQVEQLSDAPFQ